jgi:hypothetical protein
LELEPLEDRLVRALTLPTAAYLFTQVPFGTPLAMHIHPILQINVDGQPVTIPANIGVGPSSAFPLHTHDSTGIVHVESPQLRTYYLLDFFAIWNLYPSGQAVLSELGSAANVTVSAAGTTTASLTNVVLQDLQPIIINALLPNPDPVTAANEAYVSRVYQDLLDRPVDPVGLVQFTTALNRGLSRTQFVQILETSQEYRTLEVQNLYEDVLHRPADPSGLAAFTNFLANGGTVGQVEAILFGSGEYQQLMGGTENGFLTGLYGEVLNRGLDAAGQAAWSAQLAGGATPTTIAAEVIQSGEALAVRIDTYYRAYLHRPVDPSGRAAFTTLMQQGMTDGQIIALLLSSNEYYAA